MVPIFVIAGLVFLAPTLVRSFHPGRVLDDELAYRHPSVRWVYRSGKELGSIFGCIPNVRRIYIKRIVPGDGCVLVWGGAPGCIEGTSTSHVATLDLATGRDTSGEPTGDEATSTWLDWDGSRWCGTYFGLKWILPHPTQEVYVAEDPESPDSKPMRLLALTGEDHFSPALYGLRFPDGTLVIANFNGYIVCVDLNALTQSIGPGSKEPHSPKEGDRPPQHTPQPARSTGASGEPAEGPTTESN